MVVNLIKISFAWTSNSFSVLSPVLPLLHSQPFDLIQHRTELFHLVTLYLNFLVYAKTRRITSRKLQFSCKPTAVAISQEKKSKTRKSHTIEYIRVYGAAIRRWSCCWRRPPKHYSSRSNSSSTNATIPTAIIKIPTKSLHVCAVGMWNRSSERILNPNMIYWFEIWNAWIMDWMVLTANV